MKVSNHFEVSQIKEYIFVIKENISLIHPVYTNDPLNLYLIIGSHTALLLDTGCGLSLIKPIVDEIIDKKELIVFNTHYHWDHPLGNNEFDEVFIHENEVDLVSKPYDLSYFKDSPNKIVEIYAKQNFLIPPAKSIKPLRDGERFDLGGIHVEVIHCPGHSPGSICILTSKGELFTSDVAYYGDQFLPKKEDFSIVLNTLSKLIKICEISNISELYPSHREYPCDVLLLKELYKGIENIENLWDTKKAFDFFEAWQIDDPNGKFRYYISKN